MKRYPLLFFAALLLGVILTRGADAPALPTLTTVRQVRELSQDEAARGYQKHSVWMLAAKFHGQFRHSFHSLFLRRFLAYPGTDAPESHLFSH